MKIVNVSDDMHVEIHAINGKPAVLGIRSASGGSVVIGLDSDEEVDTGEFEVEQAEDY